MPEKQHTGDEIVFHATTKLLAVEILRIRERFQPATVEAELTMVDFTPHSGVVGEIAAILEVPVLGVEFDAAALGEELMQYLSTHIQIQQGHHWTVTEGRSQYHAGGVTIMFGVSIQRELPEWVLAGQDGCGVAD